MEKILEFKNATLKISKKVVLENFNFVVNEYKVTAVIGPSVSGKSTILKSLCRFAYPTTLVLKDTDIANNYNNLYEKVAVVFNNSSFVCETVYEELAFALHNQNLSRKDIDEKIRSFAEYFEITDLLNYDVTLLTNDLKSLIRILAFLILNPKVLALDDMFIYLNSRQIAMLFDYIKTNKITLLFTTSNIEDVVLADYIYVLDKCVIVDSGTRSKVLKNEKLLLSLGLGLPFFTELSTGLKYYGVLKNICNTQKELEGALWK